MPDKPKKSEAVARRERIAYSVIGLYKPEQLKADEFDSAFANVVTTAQYLEHVYRDLKRSHLFLARGLDNGPRVLNRALGNMNSAYSYANYARDQLNRLSQYVGKLGRVKQPPTAKDLILDLEALERDFPKVEYRDKHLRVTTDNIVLQYMGMEFDFGPFEIALDMGAVACNARKPYEVLALDPHWTPSHDYCHPHLTGRDLCSGDGTAAALRATTEGRVYDFFVIINQILSTYNPASPYVKLEVWVNGEDEDYFTCEICDERLHNDERYICEHCDRSICSSCSSHCDAQGVTMCRDCIDDEECDCRHRGALGCLISENDRCISCGDTPSNEDVHTCEHLHRASHYHSAGRDYGVSLCDTCAQERIDEREPCRVSYSQRNENGTHTIVESTCRYFGNHDCMLVVDMTLEEGTEPAPSEEEEAPAEQEVADASS